jgi:putative transposase
MSACAYCWSADLMRDGDDQRGRVVRACRVCGRHATSESTSLVAGHRFPRAVILLAVGYSLQLGAAAERSAGILADRGVDVSGRTVVRGVQKFGPALSEEIRGYSKPVSTTWPVDQTDVKIRGTWHYLYRGIEHEGQVLDGGLSRTRDLAAAEAFFRRTLRSTGCTPEPVVTDQAALYASAIRACAPGARHTATGLSNPVSSTHRCERNHGYVKARSRPMRGLKNLVCASRRLFSALDALQLVERDFVHVPRVAAACTGGRS